MSWSSLVTSRHVTSCNVTLRYVTDHQCLGVPWSLCLMSDCKFVTDFTPERLTGEIDQIIIISNHILKKFYTVPYVAGIQLYTSLSMKWPDVLSNCQSKICLNVENLSSKWRSLDELSGFLFQCNGLILIKPPTIYWTVVAILFFPDS